MRDIHGGDIRQRKVRLDFSVNTNPFGMPEEVREALKSHTEEAQRYPDPEYRDLREAIAKAQRRSSAPAEGGCIPGVKREQVLVGNGASELIMAVAHTFAGERILLQQPVFGGYERAFAVCGCEVFRTETGEDLAPTKSVCRQILTLRPKLAVFCNPGNPTGALILTELLDRVAEACRETGTILLTDECFLGFVPGAYEHSAVRFFPKAPKNDGAAEILVLRAFTKLYAMPGVRLGYLLCSRTDLAEMIAPHLPEWNVSASAEAAGRAALRQKDYVRKTTEVIRRERMDLDRQLMLLGFRTIPGEANFILFCSEKELWEPLLEKGILIRRCNNYTGMPEQGYYRVAVRTHEENAELIEALRTTVS